MTIFQDGVGLHLLIEQTGLAVRVKLRRYHRIDIVRSFHAR